MSNTFTLYDTVTTFQRKQRDAYDKYMAAMREIESAKGSAFYSERQRSAMEERKAAEDAARADARYWLKKTLEAMREANRKRKAVPLTQDQLSILQAMKMRTSITAAELDRIANAMDGNGLGLGVVQEFAREMAKKQEGLASMAFSKNYLAMTRDSYPIQEVERELSNIGAVCTRIVNSDGVKHVIDIGARYGERWGRVVDRDTLKREDIPASESAFFEGVSSVPFDVLQKCLNE